MPGQAKVFLYWQSGKLISFNLCLIKGNHFIDKFIGFDKELARKYHLYLVSFINNLSWCIEHGIKYYQLGITDYHPKIRFGAKLLEQYNYLRLNNQLLNFFCRFIAPLTSPVKFDPTLRLLRKNSPALIKYSQDYSTLSCLGDGSSSASEPSPNDLRTVPE